MPTAVHFPAAKVCPLCGGTLFLKNDQEETTAQVWDGSGWEEIQHGRKRCANGCGATVRLGFVWKEGKKISTVYAWS